jgi:1-acyl-sn-glycerol-3-phosphate acyltransferase
MPGILIRFVSRILLMIGRMLSRILLKVEIAGAENAPRNEPLIVVSNHFSWFDGPLLTLLLPVQPAFLIATESTRFWYWRFFMHLYNCIPIWRGKVDRRALSSALKVLRSGGVIGVFPEGGIEPTLAERRDRGELIQNVIFARSTPELAQARPGVAFLAVESEVRILPVALSGTEKIWENLPRFRRTQVTITIGEAFGPFKLEAESRGRTRRQQLNGFADITMGRIARLFPPEKRGPYRDTKVESM